MGKGMTLETPRQRSVSESTDYADVMGPDTLAGEPDCTTGSAQTIQSTPGGLAAVTLLRDRVQTLMLSTLVLRVGARTPCPLLPTRIGQLKT